MTRPVCCPGESNCYAMPMRLAGAWSLTWTRGWLFPHRASKKCGEVLCQQQTTQNPGSRSQSTAKRPKVCNPRGGFLTNGWLLSHWRRCPSHTQPETRQEATGLALSRTPRGTDAFIPYTPGLPVHSAGRRHCYIFSVANLLGLWPQLLSSTKLPLPKRSLWRIQTG